MVGSVRLPVDWNLSTYKISSVGIVSASAFHIMSKFGIRGGSGGARMWECDGSAYAQLARDARRGVAVTAHVDEGDAREASSGTVWARAWVALGNSFLDLEA